MYKPEKELYEFARFSLDVPERLLKRDGKRISLTDKAFDTLCILVRRAGELVGKDELMAEVWADSIVEENNLDQKISMLRQALGERKGKEKFIETVRGRGYRFLPAVRRVGGDVPSVEVPPPPDTERPSAAGLARNGEASGFRQSVIADPLDGEATRPAVPVTEILKSNGVAHAPRLKKWALPAIAVAVVVAAIAVFTLFRSSFDKSPAVDVPVDSIAVLPFENLTQDADAEYLSDGITESLINRLSQLSNLKVLSSSSVFRYKGKKQDVQEIGNELNVRAVLTGNVKQVGDQIVINVSLDDAKDDRRIWGEQYIRKFADILSLQADIVREVSGNLRVKLAGADEQRLAKRYTENTEAYQFYLKGQYAWNKHTRDELQKSIEYYNRAIELDPNFALAYSGLANCFGVLGNYYVRPHEAFPKAKEYAKKALELDDGLAESHVSMAALNLFYDWNWAGVAEELERSTSINPNNPGSYDIYSAYWDAMGEPDKAVAMSKRGQELEPLSPQMNTNLGNDLFYDRQYNEAASQLEKTIELEPNYYMAYMWLGQTYEQKNMYRDAIEIFQKGAALEDDPQLTSLLGHAYAVSGERQKAEQMLEVLRETSKQRYVSQYLFAVVYLGLDDKDQAFAALEEAFKERSFFLIWLTVEPKFDPVREDPRFKDLLRRIGQRS